jgi:hypothetical protein
MLLPGRLHRYNLESISKLSWTPEFKKYLLSSAIGQALF